MQGSRFKVQGRAFKGIYDLFYLILLFCARRRFAAMIVFTRETRKQKKTERLTKR